MPDAPDLAYAFGLQPAAAVHYFQSLGYQLTWDWRQTADAVRAQAFAVSSATQIDILRDLHDGLQRVLDEGLTERDFVQQLTPILQRKGWWGTRVDVDARGGAQKIQLGSPARLKTIYRTNIQSAMMAGRWRDFTANVSSRPYFQYVAVMDLRTRPTHAAMNGRIFRYDDPIWKTHWPPWDYNCRCRVRALSQRDLDRDGLEVESSAGRLHTVSQPWGVDKRTGEVIRRPGKVFRVMGADGKPIDLGPAPGFGNNPGMGGGGWDPIGNLPDILPDTPVPSGAPGVVARILEGQKTWRDYGLPDLRNVATALRNQSPLLLPHQSDFDSALRALATALDVSVELPRFVTTPIETVAIIYQRLSHIIEKRADAREQYANFILPSLTDPFEIWLTLYDDGTLRRRYIGLFTGRHDLLVVTRINQDGTIVWNVMQARDKRMNDMRTGDLVWAKDRSGGPDR